MIPRTRKLSTRGGEYILSFHSEVSPKHAQEKAFLEARRAALEKVLGTNVSSVDLLLSHNEGSAYSGVVVTSSSGVIKGYKNKTFAWKFQKIEGEDSKTPTISLFCEADFFVGKNLEKPDPSFVATVKGGRPVYRHKDKEIFTVVPEAPGYLTVFYWSDKDSTSIVFPSNDFGSNFMKASEEKTITLNFYKDDPKRLQERGVLFFVLTREKWSYSLLRDKTGGESRAKIDRWIAEIPTRDRYVYAVPIVIELR